MADIPRLQVTGLPAMTSEEAAATSSPARGAEMTSFLRSRLNQKNRAPALVHSWAFWHDRQEPQPPQSTRSSTSANETTAADQKCSNNYEERLEQLAEISDVRQFWSVFNNFDIARLPTRDSVHLFHKGVKPVWEDPRNLRGGSWTFRIPKQYAVEFWRDVCLMAIGETLQAAVEDPSRQTFLDDICGVSVSVRFNAMLIQIWNRDGNHQAAIDRIAETVLKQINPDIKLRVGGYYYKKHSEHAGFSAGTNQDGQAKKPDAVNNQHASVRVPSKEAES